MYLQSLPGWTQSINLNKRDLERLEFTMFSILYEKSSTWAKAINKAWKHAWVMRSWKPYHESLTGELIFGVICQDLVGLGIPYGISVWEGTAFINVCVFPVYSYCYRVNIQSCIFNRYRAALNPYILIVGLGRTWVADAGNSIWEELNLNNIDQLGMKVCFNSEMVEVVSQIAHWDIDFQANLPRLGGTWQLLQDSYTRRVSIY